MQDLPEFDAAAFARQFADLQPADLVAPLEVCVPCRDTHEIPDRLAVAVVMDLPMCAACAGEARIVPTELVPRQRLAADLRPDVRAKSERPERKRLGVPPMPPLKGDACCWGCTPDAVESECRLHGPRYTDA